MEWNNPKQIRLHVLVFCCELVENQTGTFKFKCLDKLAFRVLRFPVANGEVAGDWHDVEQHFHGMPCALQPFSIQPSCDNFCNGWKWLVKTQPVAAAVIAADVFTYFMKERKDWKVCVVVASKGARKLRLIAGYLYTLTVKLLPELAILSGRCNMCNSLQLQFSTTAIFV